MTTSSKHLSKPDTFSFQGPQKQCNMITVSLTAHDETYIECPSVCPDEVQRSDFSQLAVNIDSENLSEIRIPYCHARNHATLSFTK